MRVLPALFSPFCALVCAALAGASFIAGCDVDFVAALESFAFGVGGSTYAISEVLVAATPLLLCGLAVSLAFRAGLFSIGAEGQFLAGMLGATAIGVANAPVAIVLLCGAAGGAAIAAVAAWLREARRVPEVLSTLLLNFVVLHGVALAVQTALREPGGVLPQSARIGAASTLESWIDGARLHGGFAIGCLLALVLAFVVARTAVGLRWRAIGDSRAAARLAGFPVARDLTVVFLLSGALAGLGGAIEICGVTGRLYENPSPGTGYTAIAVALLGRNRPLGVWVAAVLFGALEVGCLAMSRDLGVPRGLAQVVEGMAIVAFLAAESPVVRRFFSARFRAPDNGVVT